MFRQVRDEIEDMRKKVAIARRKAENAYPQQQHEPDPSEAGPSKRARLSPVPIEGIKHSVNKEDELEDFSFICQFFVAGGGDSGDDEQVWANLEKLVSCTIVFFSLEFSHALFVRSPAELRLRGLNFMRLTIAKSTNRLRS